MLVVIAGSELLTGNLLGSLFVAYLLAVRTGVVTAEAPLRRLADVANAKGHAESDWHVFLRAVGCIYVRGSDERPPDRASERA